MEKYKDAARNIFKDIQKDMSDIKYLLGHNRNVFQSKCKWLIILLEYVHEEYKCIKKEK